MGREAVSTAIDRAIVEADTGGVDTPGSRDEISRRLAEIDEELWSLDAGDFTTKYELQKERDRLRAIVRSEVDRDADRSTEDLLAELESRRKALTQIQKSMVNSAGMSGGGDGSSAGPADGVRLNTGIVAATGAQELSQRISKLETLLTKRGAL